MTPYLNNPSEVKTKAELLREQLVPKKEGDTPNEPLRATLELVGHLANTLRSVEESASHVGSIESRLSALESDHSTPSTPSTPVTVTVKPLREVESRVVLDALLLAWESIPKWSEGDLACEVMKQLESALAQFHLRKQATIVQALREMNKRKNGGG
jgi:hypothetical protein